MNTLKDAVNEWQKKCEHTCIQANDAVKSFSFGRMQGLSDFDRTVTLFVQHLEKALYNGNCVDEKVAHITANRILRKAAGESYTNLIMDAFAGHGFHRVMNIIVQHYCEEQTDLLFARDIRPMVDTMDFSTVKDNEEITAAFERFIPARILKKVKARIEEMKKGGNNERT